MSRRRELFYHQLERLLEAGTNVRSAMEILGRSGANTSAPIARAVLSRLERGGRLSEGLQDAGLDLPAAHAGLMDVAEDVGRMPRLLAQLREWDTESRKMRREFLMPLAYPAVLLLASILIVPLPKLVESGSEAYLQTILPPLLLVGLVVLAVLLPRWLGVEARERLLNWIPGVSGIRRQLEGSHFLFGLGLSLELGDPLPAALGRASRATGNPGLRQWGRQLQAEAEAGSFRIESLAQSGWFGSFAGQVLAAAAETGNLADASLNTGRLLREEALASARRFSSVLAVLLYLVAASVVGWTVISFYSRLYTVQQL